MTREEAQQVEQQLSKRHPDGSVEVTRVAGGVWIETRDNGGYTFLHLADGSPLLTLFGAYPETEPGDLSGRDPRGVLGAPRIAWGRPYPGSLPAARLPAIFRWAYQVRRTAGVKAGRPSRGQVSPEMGCRVRARRKLPGLP